MRSSLCSDRTNLKLHGNRHLERISILASEMLADERAKSHFFLFPCCLLIMLHVLKVCLLLKLLCGYLFIASVILHTTSSSGVEDGTVFFWETVMSYWKQQYSNHFPQDCQHCTENKSQVIIIIRGRESLEYCYNVSTFRGLTMLLQVVCCCFHEIGSPLFVSFVKDNGSNFYRGGQLLAG